MYWNNDGQGMMNGSGYALFAIGFMIIFFLFLIWLIFRVVDHGSHSHRHDLHQDKSNNSSAAQEHLNMRLARGDISTEEYAILKEHLRK